MIGEWTRAGQFLSPRFLEEEDEPVLQLFVQEPVLQVPTGSGRRSGCSGLTIVIAEQVLERTHGRHEEAVAGAMRAMESGGFSGEFDGRDPKWTFAQCDF